MSSEVQVRFREQLRGRIPRLTRPVLHCKSEKQASFIKDKVEQRMKQCGLELHPYKTRIIYCQDDERQLEYDVTTFTFFGIYIPEKVKSNEVGKPLCQFFTGDQ